MNYTHRNGETELPTIEGAYWFDGMYKVYTTEYVGEPLHGEWRSTLKEMVPCQDYLPYLYPETKNVYFVGSETPTDLDNYVGRWWGPIVLTPPWEQEAA